MLSASYKREISRAIARKQFKDVVWEKDFLDIISLTHFDVTGISQILSANTYD